MAKFNAVMRALDKIDRSLDRKIKSDLMRIDCVEQYKSLEGGKTEVIKKMEKFAAQGWELRAFGWANGFQGGWYAMMTRHLRGPGVGKWK